MNRLTKFIKCAALLAAVVLAVPDATGEISVTASRDYVDRKVRPKRDKDDYKIYRKVKDLWTWTNWVSPDATASAPADFLAAVNAPTAEPVYFTNGTWCGANQFWPNGNRKYMNEIGPYGTGTELSLNWEFTAYAEDGTTELFRFGATSVRTNATDETLICWDSINPSVRLVTTDQIDGALKKTDGALRPLPKYLWLYEPDDPYLDDAKAWYTNYDHVVSGGCSAIRKGGLLGRNFDSPYDERAEFVVKVPATNNRRASVGVSNLGTNITEQFVVSGHPSPLYKVLPGVIVDGINDAGVVAEINIIPRNPTRDPAQGIDPKTGVNRQLSAFAVVRYVLDNFISAAEAAADVAANYYIPAGSPHAYHWMIADKDGTYIVEDGQVVQPASTTDGCAMVNFRVVSAGAYDPSGGYATDPYGSGSARFAALINAPSVQAGLVAVRYTHAYATGWPWLDEFAGATDAQGLIPHDNTARLLTYANEKITPKLDPTTRLPKARGNGCWQTIHSAIYDITNKTLRIAVQETDDWFVFHLPASDYVKSVNGKTGDVKLEAADVGALPASGAVKSINGKTGEVNLEAADVGALPANPGWYDIQGDADSFVFQAWTGDNSAIGLYAGENDSFVGLYNGISRTDFQLHADHMSVSNTNGSFIVKYPDEGGTLTTEEKTNEKIDPIVSNTNIVFLIDGSVLTISTNGVPIWSSSSAEPGPGPSPTVVKRFALFIIPLNDTAYASDVYNHYTQFELKASTNNFSISASENSSCCFYSHSGHADGFYSTNDRMHLFLNHGGADQRSYVRITNTLEGMPNYAPSEVIVIVDAKMMNPDRSDGAWLYEDNESLTWTWVRMKNEELEPDPGTDHCLWRPISPVRWFAELPTWAK